MPPKKSTKTKARKSVKAVKAVRSKSPTARRSRSASKQSRRTKSKSPSRTAKSAKAKWLSTGNKAPIPSKDTAGKRQIVMRTLYTCVEKPGEFRICKIDVDGKKKYVKVDLSKTGGSSTPTTNSLIKESRDKCKEQCKGWLAGINGPESDKFKKGYDACIQKHNC